MLLNACYNDYGMNTEDFDMVVTLYDDRADFGAINTFSMPDTIIHLVAEGERDNISRKFDEEIKALVAVNMEALGYERELNPDQNGADVVVLISVSSSDWVAYDYYYGWYDFS